MARTVAFRVGVIIALSLLVTLASYAVNGPQPASACSIVLPTDARFGDWVHRVPIVAIGRWEAASDREVTFAVEQPLKGTKVGERLAVDNRTTYTSIACSPYDEPFREGYRFVPGERAVVLLEKEVEGLWQVGYLSLAAFEVPESLDSPLEGVGWYFGDSEAGTPTDIRLSTIVAASGFEGEISLAAAAPPPRQTSVTSASVPASDERNWWPIAALGAGAMGVAAGALGLRRVRR